MSVSSASTATTANHIAAGLAGQIHYQTAPNTTSFIVTGTNSQVLIGGTTPAWSAINTLSVSSASTATTANHIAAGSAGQIPYQTASNTTSFIGAGTSGYYLKSNGASAPSWENTNTIISGLATTTSLTSYAALSGATFTGTVNGSINNDTTYTNYVGWSSAPTMNSTAITSPVVYNGMTAGTGDGNTSTLFNLSINSWDGIGFVDTCYKKCVIYMDLRNGIVNASSFNATSDYRIKKSIKLITNTIDNLNPIQYYNNFTKREDMGFIAHEVQEHFPFLVNGKKDAIDMQTLNYTGLIALLTKEMQDLKKDKINKTEEIQTQKQEIQTQKQEIQTQKQEIEVLKEENRELKSRLDNIELLVKDLISKK